MTRFLYFVFVQAVVSGNGTKSCTLVGTALSVVGVIMSPRKLLCVLFFFLKGRVNLLGMIDMSVIAIDLW